MAASWKVSRKLKIQQNSLVFIGTVGSAFQAALFPEARHVHPPTIGQKKPLSWACFANPKTGPCAGPALMSARQAGRKGACPE